RGVGVVRLWKSNWNGRQLCHPRENLAGRAPPSCSSYITGEILPIIGGYSGGGKVFGPPAALCERFPLCSERDRPTNKTAITNKYAPATAVRAAPSSVLL